MRTVECIDRRTNQRFEEKIAGEKALRFTLENPVGRWILKWAVRRPWLSKLYGMYQDSTLSRSSIAGFVQNLDINMHEAEESIDAFKSFNEFFARRLKPDARPVDPKTESLVSPADGRMLVIPKIGEKQIVHIKGIDFSLFRFLKDERWIQKFQGGSMAIVRLCPADYHRYHFPVAGWASAPRRLGGWLYSVNPLCFETIPDVFSENERQITEIKTDSFSSVLMVEVGAAMVGKIVQTYSAGVEVSKGEEKGYFKFGASTVVLLLEPNRICWDPDLIANSNDGLETLVRMGEKVGRLIEA